MCDVQQLFCHNTLRLSLWYGRPSSRSPFALLACNLQNLSSESSQKSGFPLIRRVSVISLSFLLSSCSLSETSLFDLQYSFQLQESTILSDWYASVDHEAGEQGVTFVMFGMVIHSQTMTLTFTDWHDWIESYLFFIYKTIFIFILGILHLVIVTFQVQYYWGRSVCLDLAALRKVLVVITQRGNVCCSCKL